MVQQARPLEQCHHVLDELLRVSIVLRAWELEVQVVVADVDVSNGQDDLQDGLRHSCEFARPQLSLTKVQHLQMVFTADQLNDVMHGRTEIHLGQRELLEVLASRDELLHQRIQYFILLLQVLEDETTQVKLQHVSEQVLELLDRLLSQLFMDNRNTSYVHNLVSFFLLFVKVVALLAH